MTQTDAEVRGAKRIWRGVGRRVNARRCASNRSKENLKAGVQHTSRDISLEVLAIDCVVHFPLIRRYQKVYVFLVDDRYLDFAGLTGYKVDAVLR